MRPCLFLLFSPVLFSYFLSSFFRVCPCPQHGPTVAPVVLLFGKPLAPLFEQPVAVSIAVRWAVVARHTDDRRFTATRLGQGCVFRLGVVFECRVAWLPF